MMQKVQLFLPSLNRFEPIFSVEDTEADVNVGCQSILSCMLYILYRLSMHDRVLVYNLCGAQNRIPSIQQYFKSEMPSQMMFWVQFYCRSLKQHLQQ